jgi:hypothetical protein
MVRPSRHPEVARAEWNRCALNTRNRPTSSRDYHGNGSGCMSLPLWWSTTTHKTCNCEKRSGRLCLGRTGTTSACVCPGVSVSVIAANGVRSEVVVVVVAVETVCDCDSGWNSSGLGLDSLVVCNRVTRANPRRINDHSRSSLARLL